jgi:hypothetical protein
MIAEHAYIHAIEASEIKCDTLIGVGAGAVVLPESSSADSAPLEPFSAAIASGLHYAPNSTDISATYGQTSDYDPLLDGRNRVD